MLAVELAGGVQSVDGRLVILGFKSSFARCRPGLTPRPSFSWNSFRSCRNVSLIPFTFSLLAEDEGFLLQG